MKKFETTRIKKIEITTKQFKYPIPLAIVSPKNNIDHADIIIYNSGLLGTISGSMFLNHHFYDNYYFVCYDKMFHGSNKNKPSQYKKKYLIELDNVVNYIRSLFPNRQIYLFGESWGACINLLYYKKIGFNKIKNVIIWNMPTKWGFHEKYGFKTIIEIVSKILLSFFLKIPFILPNFQSDFSKITRNELLIKIKQMSIASKNHSFSTLSCWRYIRIFKKLIFECNNYKYHFLYIQSGQDIMAKTKTIDLFRLKLTKNHFAFIPTGYHILSLEPYEANIMYKIIEKYMKNII